MGSYVPTTAAEREEMLAAIGVKSLEDLYQAVPQGMLLNGTLNIPEGMSELEVREAVTAMAEKNKVYKTVLRGAEVDGGILWCVTELVSKAQLDKAVSIVKEVLK